MFKQYFLLALRLTHNDFSKDSPRETDKMAIPFKINYCSDVKFNIVRPAGEHQGIFVEWAELMYFAIRELGYEATIKVAEFCETCINIVIGIHFEDSFLDSLPDNSVIINTEPLFAGPMWQAWSEKAMKYASKYRIWDYDDNNISTWASHGFNEVEFFKFGYQRELKRIPKLEESNVPIDILFYGSFVERRVAILDKLQRSGIRLETLFGVYGDKRDEVISRSKLVINIHAQESGMFEIVRAHYLLNNGIAMVCEVNENTSIETRILECIERAPYSDLVERCHAVLENEIRLTELRERSLERFSRYPQVAFMEPLIGRLK